MPSRLPQKLMTLHEEFELGSFAWTPSGKAVSVVSKTGHLFLW